MTWLITGTQKVPPTVWDPDFLNVSLLLHGDGTNGSTTITDNSPSPKTVTAVGNAQISTTAPKFGTGSIFLDGTGDWLTTPSNTGFAFGTADFTIEGWLKPAVVTASDRIFFDTRVDPDDTGIVFFIDPNGRLNSYQGGSLRANSGSLLLTSNVWQHFAYVRAAGVLYVYIGGSLGGSAALTTNLTSPGTVRIGVREDDTLPYEGYIDDLRITKGVARYTANFTPPTAAFPDI
jgi:hypothetical protein